MKMRSVFPQPASLDDFDRPFIDPKTAIAKPIQSRGEYFIIGGERFYESEPCPSAQTTSQPSATNS